MFNMPFSYDNEEGRRLKDLRDLHDTVLLTDAYFRQTARGNYNITQLKSYQLLKLMLEEYDPEFAKAMYSTGTAVGDEWVPTEMSAQLHEAYEIEFNLESHIPRWEMPSNPADYIARFASALSLTAETQSKSVEIIERAQEIELTSGRGPTGIAAAALYVAALINGEKRTQREVADVAGVTEVTIRNRYKELLSELDLEKEIKKTKKKKE